MEPIDFPEANGTLGAPPGMEDQVFSLRVFRGGEYCISLWQPTEAERERIAAGAPIYLSLQSGRTQPPCLLAVESPFDPHRTT